MENEDLKTMFGILEWELEDKIKRLELNKVTVPKRMLKAKRDIYLEVLDIVRNTTKGAI